MAIWIQISSGSDKPIYSQIVEQMSEAIARGHLAAGDKLPAVRKLAEELVINPNTVARAYSLLERADLVVTKTGSGTFVKAPELRSRDASDINALTERMDTLITRAINLGFKPDDIVSVFKKRLNVFIDKKKGGRKND